MKKTTRKQRPAPRKSGLDVLAGMGRYGDTEVAHLTPGEVVVPRRVMQNDPALRRHAAQSMTKAGLDPERYVVGSPKSSRNPRTGAPEFADLIYTDQGWVSANTGQVANFAQDQNSFANTGSYGGSNVAPTTEQNQVRPANAMSAPAPGRNWGVADNQATNQQLAQATGFQGDFGNDAFNQYMSTATAQQQQAARDVLNAAGQQNRIIDWSAGSPAEAPNDYNASGSSRPAGTILGQPTNPNNSSVNQGLADLVGYNGEFGGWDPNSPRSGQFNQWLYSQPNWQELEAQTGKYLFDQGQVARANLYSWDRNGNGTVEGTEAAGVTQNPDGSYTWPGGYQKGPAEDPYLSGKPIWQINPDIPGAPQEYAWGTAPNGVMPAGAWPETMRDPTFGTTTYNAAPPPSANGQWINPQFLPWDTRNGGTGDPYVPWTEEWARKQAAAGNGYAAQALINAGYDLYDIAPDGNIGALTSGQGSSNAAGYDRGSKLTVFNPVNGFGIWQNPDGRFFTTVNGAQILMEPGPNGLWWDTLYGTYRDGNGMFVDANGRPITTEYSPAGSWDAWRLWGSDVAKSRMGQFANMDMSTLSDGNNTPVAGNYARGGASGIPTAGGTGGSSNPFTYPSGGQQQGGGTQTPGTNGQTQTGTGLIPGTANPYSYTDLMLMMMLSGMGGLNINLGGSSSTPLTPPASNPYGLNLGYYMTPGGYPLYTSTNNDEEEGGGIGPISNNRQTVDFRSPFAYL